MDLLEVYETRRSVNFFEKGKEIPQDVLENIINKAVLAPSAFNLQPWEIVVVKSMENKEKLCKLSNNQEKILDGSVTLMIVGNKNGFATDSPVWDEMLVSMGGNKEAVAGAQGAAGFLYGSSEERKIKFAESNAGLLGMSIMNMATYYGVDSHPMSGVDFEGIERDFDLGEGKSLVMLIVLGYFDKSKALYPRRPRRLYKDIAKEI